MTEAGPAPLHVGQLNLPAPDDFRRAFEGVFARRFYTNHGPLEHEADAALAAYFGVRHAISVVNGTAALMLLLKALGRKGEVITPAFTFPATVQAICWAGLTPVFCDVEPETHNISARLAEPLIGERTVAILGVHVWGRGCDVAPLQALANARGIRLIFDAAHATGCTHMGVRIGGFGDAEMFSFHATKVLNGAEGGCIATNDDELAALLRKTRSFHEMTPGPEGRLHLNAKLSEAQAAMLLLGLERMEEFVADNRRRYETYRERLSGLKGVRFVDHAAGEQSNYQYVVAELDEPAFGMSRDRLLEALQAQNVLARRYFHPGVHRTAPFDRCAAVLPVTDALCERLIQLPTGQAVTDDDVLKVCDLVRNAR